MFRFNRLVCVLAVCVVVTTALGAATKIRWFDNIAEANLDADGMAILNYVPGQDNIVAQVILSDLEVDTPYVVGLRTPGSWELVGTNAVLDDGFFPISAGTSGQLVSNDKGHLTFHSSTDPDTGDFSNSDVLIIRLQDWQAAFFPPPSAPPATFPLSVPVRLVGYNPTAP